MKLAEMEALALNDCERAAMLERMRGALGPEDYRWVETSSAALPQLIAVLKEHPASLRKLQHLLFGPKTERTEQVCPPAAPLASSPPTPRRRRGHGRIKARDYTGADWVQVSHPSLKAGQPCPRCPQGTLRAQSRPAIILRIEGSPPIAATGYELERLRCDTCGAVFTAPAPAEAGQEKYAPSVAVTIATLRYGTGVPHHRLARLQRDLGVPLPESTQWELLEPLAEQAQPVFRALVVLAANASVLHLDDTTMRILDLRRAGSADAAEIEPGRKGTFTTNILAETPTHPIALFFTGWHHAGENLAAVLRQRAAELGPPIQMCDALAANRCHDHPTIVAHCLAHGRREIVTAAPSFPEECRHVLAQIAEVYRLDAEAQALGLDPKQRLAHHQSYSAPVMARLHTWLEDKIEGRHVEPNSVLGQAIGYLLKHWEPLTLFLREPGAPLDNNPSERALKMAILHRKNSLSYKTTGGARTGDLFMSLIHTCRLNHVNPFAYLLAITTHPEAVGTNPEAWLPWNYPSSATPDAPEHDPPG